MHFNASGSLTQPVLDCIVYLTLTQYPYDPDNLLSSANQCILRNVNLRSNLSRNSTLRRIAEIRRCSIMFAVGLTNFPEHGLVFRQSWLAVTFVTSRSGLPVLMNVQNVKIHVFICIC